LFSIGNVILISGGLESSDNTTIDYFYIYSPGNVCNYALASLPIPLVEPVFVLLINQIYICSGFNSGTNTYNQICWKYDISTNAWITMASSKFIQPTNVGIVYNNKLHMLNDEIGKSEVYDPVTNSWNSWNTKSLHTIGSYACHVQWKDAAIIFGGTLSSTIVQIYNFTTNLWKDLQPMTNPHAGFGCTIIPQNQNHILVLGANYLGDTTRADIYDIATNTWKRAASSNNHHNGVQLIALGQCLSTFLGGNTFLRKNCNPS